ncbi:MAG: ABC transporter ATP-binding protein, partial [Spirochaetaceae bacterium]|nr:ABC transporter ATP-binding protein [Spirochaetaceae bacterium]
MKNLKIFLSYYKAHWKLFLGDMICAVIVALVDTVFPMMSKYTLDAIIPSFELNLLFKMILVMTLMYVVRTVAFWFINY